MDILICDDHALLAEALAIQLRGRGHDVTVVCTPEEALDAATDGPPDLCLMDLRFPERPLAGLQAVPELRQRAPDMALLLLSGAMTEEVARAAIAAGANGVAGKDIALPALEAAVQQITAGRVVVTRDLARHSARSALTPREREVVDLIAAGRSTPDIAESLGIAVSTVRGHVETVLAKLGVHSKLDAAAVAGRVVGPERRTARAAP